MNEPGLITGFSTAREVDELLDGARLTLYGQGGEWGAVVWIGEVYGVGKGSAWYVAADRALRSAKGKAGR